MVFWACWSAVYFSIVFLSLQDQILLTKVSSFRMTNVENEAERENAGGYHTVAFSYGGSMESSDLKNNDTESGFQPPFSVPEHLLQKLPPTEKVHQIIARTAMFVSKHGGQSEIVLRVKQGDNPTFGFLMPDHNLHPYFRFLIDHQELLMSGTDGRAIEEENKADSGLDQMSSVGGALSLLGSVYGTGEDEEGATENAPALTKNNLEELTSDSLAVSVGSVQNNSSLISTSKAEPLSKPSFPSLKEKSHVIKRNRSISTVKTGTATGVKKDGDSVGSVSSTVNKLQPLISPGLSKVETTILEPPSDLKRVVDKIVEFILRNGKEFEAVLVQQDTKHGRFPFLLPSNQYHPYYIQALQKAQESRLSGKSIPEKNDSLGHGLDKKTGSKETDALSLSDIPYESDRKEKFKMVIGKSKKDGQEPPSKVPQPQVGVSVDAAAAAAILQAATKGIKHPNLGVLSKAITGIGQCPSSEGGDSLLSAQPQTSNPKPAQNGLPGVPIPVAKAIAKSAAVATASEADSSEASLTREQKLKAERLKRAKMFAALIKSGAAPLKSEPSRGLSAEPSESVLSGSDSEVLPLTGRERESSLAPLDVDACNKIEKPEKKGFADEHVERRSKRSYRSRSKREEEEEEREEEEDSNHKHSRKKRRSHRSSRHSRDRHKHRKRRSSSQDTESQHQRKDTSTSVDEHDQDSSEDEHRRSRHRHKYDSSLDHERHSRQRYQHDSSDEEYTRSRNRHKHDRDSSEDKHKHDRDSSEDEHRHSRHRHKYESSLDNGKHSRWRHRHKHDSDDDEHRHSKDQQKHSSSYGNEHRHRHREKSLKHRKRSRSEREADLEEGEILTKSDQSKVSEGGNDASREASVDLSKSYEEVKPQSQQSETAEVSNDLRAKIRAMLMATL
ncbi:splicing factor, suppressor of white-apricot homolog isoform X2 [Jatropha curcas]|uniref:splicing factor, suppressor of white-apricot homolog isoform X2 n=1 Tax=Jatropha curcas TaxID=180498 RepID=UPI0018938C4B|nr:splicing factor, suppressor of white-apricot homolog isoform X2 [Jatropha curcas]